MAKFFRKKEVASYIKAEFNLDVSVKSLDRYITKGGGPLYHRFGNRCVVYTLEDVNSWIESKLGKAYANSSQES